MTASGEVPSWAVQGGLFLTAVMIGLLAGIDPKYAVSAALGLTFMALVLSNLALGVAIFAVAAFLDVLPFGGAGVTFAKALGFLLVLSWLATLASSPDTENDFFTDHPVFSYFLILFLGWVCLSLLWAEEPSAGFQNAYRYVLNIVLFLVVYTAVRDRKEATWVVAAFLVGALISGVYGILAPAPPVSADDVARLGGAGVDANELAALLVAALALSTAFAAGWRESPLVRLGALAVAGTCVIGVLLSFSRGGLVALTVALLAAIVLGGRYRGAALAFTICVVVGAGSYLLFVATPEQQARITQLEGGTGRSDIWKVGWRMVESSPTNGVGVGNFPVTSIHFLLEPGAIQRDEFIVDEPKVAHNIYLEVLAELGIVGLAMFLTILAFSVISAIRAARKFTLLGDRRMELLSRSVAVALIGLLAADFFASDQFSKQLWLLLALGPTLLRIARTGGSSDAEREGPERRVEPRYA